MLLKRKTSAETLKLQEKYGVPYLVFPSLENTGLVRHAFSTRLGGCSTGDLATMNLSSTRGDDPENVKENFQRFGAAVGFDPKDLVLSLQTHTTNVRLVTEEDRGKGFTRPRDYKDVGWDYHQCTWSCAWRLSMQTACLSILWIRCIVPSDCLIPAGEER